LSISVAPVGKDPGDISTIEDAGSVEEARDAWHEFEAQLTHTTVS